MKEENTVSDILEMPPVKHMTSKLMFIQLQTTVEIHFEMALIQGHPTSEINQKL